jgi:hypothetical protein
LLYQKAIKVKNVQNNTKKLHSKKQVFELFQVQKKFHKALNLKNFLLGKIYIGREFFVKNELVISGIFKNKKNF